MKLIRYAVPAFAIAAAAGQASAQQDKTQTVSFEVQAIEEMEFTGSPSLVISTATAGSAPVSVTANASYALTTNRTSRKITAALNSAMPTDVTLSVNLAAPSGAASAGTVELGTVAKDVVTGIGTVSASGLNVTYTLSATASAGVQAASTRTVTYTITTGA
jgi:hypothetical protein